MHYSLLFLLQSRLKWSVIREQGKYNFGHIVLPLLGKYLIPKIWQTQFISGFFLNYGSALTKRKLLGINVYTFIFQVIQVLYKSYSYIFIHAVRDVYSTAILVVPFIFELWIPTTRIYSPLWRQCYEVKLKSQESNPARAPASSCQCWDMQNGQPPTSKTCCTGCTESFSHVPQCVPRFGLITSCLYFQ